MGIWQLIFIGIGIYLAISAAIETWESESKVGNLAKGKRWLQEAKNLFDNSTKRFLKNYYPYAQYLEALAFSKKTGYFNKNLSDAEINFYLSYPKKFQIVDKDILYVNGVNLGKIDDCPLFMDNGLIRSFYKPNMLENMGDNFFIDEYVINTDYTHIISEEGARRSSNHLNKKLLKEATGFYSKIESESKEYLEHGKEFITEDLKNFMEDIKNHDYTLDELKELYKKNNKKWQDEYLNTHPKNAEIFFNDYTDNNRYSYIYKKNAWHYQAGDACPDISHTNEPELCNDVFKINRLADKTHVKRKDLYDKYKYLVKDAELKYGIENQVK